MARQSNTCYMYKPKDLSPRRYPPPPGPGRCQVILSLLNSKTNHSKKLIKVMLDISPCAPQRNLGYNINENNMS